MTHPRLQGKVQEFATPVTETSRVPSGGPMRRSAIEEDAIMTLVELGDRRIEAEHLLDRAKQASPNLSTTEALIREMLRLRTARA